MGNKDILYKMMILLGMKYINNKKEYFEIPQFIYAKKLFDNNKYFETYCYVLANIDIFTYENNNIRNFFVNKIAKRILELKKKIYTPEEIAKIVSQEFSTR